VVGYDDLGHGVLVQGATVMAGGATGLTGPDGLAHLILPPVSYWSYET